MYLNLTSDVNGSNFNLSSLLYRHGNISCPKESKNTFKSLSTHPYRCTYTLAIKRVFHDISEHARLVQHAHYFRPTCLLDAGLSRTRIR